MGESGGWLAYVAPAVALLVQELDRENGGVQERGRIRVRISTLLRGRTWLRCCEGCWELGMASIGNVVAQDVGSSSAGVWR